MRASRDSESPDTMHSAGARLLAEDSDEMKAASGKGVGGRHPDSEDTLYRSAIVRATLGHSNLQTTARYLQIRQHHIQAYASKFDLLAVPPKASHF